MDWTSLIVCVGIALYGWLEYRRRETAHRLELARLARGEGSLARTLSLLPGNLLFLGSVCLILVLAIAMLLYYSVVHNTSAAGPLRAVALIMSSPLAIMILMFIRDLRLLRARRPENPR
ncbi:MAG TPA: hypothetical protein VL126_12710 [Bacteroidota bacterium]|nr:hypothetical protein [Bacteroidota bacterium]